MPLSTQTKLLRVLEQREFQRVGGEKTIRVDVRIITATNQELRRLVAMGEFRRDLYFRLNVLHIELPPLRERREDIPLLVDAFVEDACQRHDRSFPGISQEAMEILISHFWPGNVRELRNLVESMVVLAPGRAIRPDDIPEEVRSPSSGSSLLPMTTSGMAVQPAGESAAGIRPELEFVFRTLVDLRVDMDDLRRDFEEYRRTHDYEVPVTSLSDRYVDVSGAEVIPTGEAGTEVMEVGQARGGEVSAGAPPDAPVGGDDTTPSQEDEVVYRSGMTMEDLEREAIRRALKEMNGNRRKAAEQLGIGERTLYRKIRKYGLDD
jgi:DNA-binding NtrC family response regulator